MNPKGIPDNFIEVSHGNWAHPSRVNPHMQTPDFDKGILVQPKDPWLKHVKFPDSPKPPRRIPQSSKPLLNVTEQRCFDLLESEGVTGIMKQAITLRLDSPFKRYTPDLAYIVHGILVLIEVKGLHRFRRAGIAKAALAAKTYPRFLFKLYEWIDGGWKITLL